METLFYIHFYFLCYNVGRNKLIFYHYASSSPRCF
jgi:hypothetical protein